MPEGNHAPVHICYIAEPGKDPAETPFHHKYQQIRKSALGVALARLRVTKAQENTYKTTKQQSHSYR